MRILHITLLIAVAIAGAVMAEPGEFLNHILESGDSLNYIWFDTISQPYPGSVSVLACISGTYLVRIEWWDGSNWYEYTSPLYREDILYEDQFRPRVSYLGYCAVSVQTSRLAFGKKVAYMLYTPFQADNAYPYP